jgi:diazepam-binding inhibitor (GABA receptor modulator, acyl-CoA-binding protein)
MDLNQEFQEATARSKQLPEQSNENLLKLYSLFKQAVEGDVNIEKPANPFDMVGNAKFNSWNKLKGTSKEDAMKQYIEFVKSLGQ